MRLIRGPLPLFQEFLLALTCPLFAELFPAFAGPATRPSRTAGFGAQAWSREDRARSELFQGLENARAARGKDKPRSDVDSPTRPRPRPRPPPRSGSPLFTKKQRQPTALCLGRNPRCNLSTQAAAYRGAMCRQAEKQSSGKCQGGRSVLLGKLRPRYTGTVCSLQGTEKVPTWTGLRQGGDRHWPNTNARARAAC